jgi:hypothetical protein
MGSGWKEPIDNSPCGRAFSLSTRNEIGIIAAKIPVLRMAETVAGARGGAGQGEVPNLRG